MIVAAEPVTSTIDGRVHVTPVGEAVPGFDALPYRVRVALLNHGRVHEVADPVDAAGDDDDNGTVVVATDPLSCARCGTVFETRRSLGQHIRWAHRDEPA